MAFDVGSAIAHIKADLSEFTNNIGEAKSQAGSLGDSIGNVASSIRTFAEQASVFVGVEVAGLGLLGKQAVDVAAQFEQTQVSFGTILGSEDKAAKLMREIMEFEQHTPFDIQTLTNGAKQLLAFGVGADEVVPKIKQLTDISQGQTARLTELVSIYGQVNAIQRLNGREVLRLSSIGVPIYQQLAEYYDKMGTAAKGSGTAVNAFGETVSKVSKNNAATLEAANTKLKEQNAQLKILESEHPKAGLATEKHNLAVMKLKDSIAATTTKIGDHTISLKSMGGQAHVTAKDIQEMIQKGEVSAADFNAVMDQMTSKGGMFFQENIRQMSTFNGIMSSVRSQVQYAILNLMGIDIGAADEVRKGGLFDTLRNGAAALLDELHKLQPMFAQIGQNKTFQLAIQGIVIALASLLVILPVVAIAFNPVALAVLAIEAIIVGLYVAWNSNFLGVQTITKTFITNITTWFNTIFIPNFNQLKVWWAAHWTAISAELSGIWKIMQGILEVAWAVFSGFIKIGLDLNTHNWKGAWDDVVKLVQGAWEGIKSIFNGIIQFLAGWGGELISALVKPFEDAWNKISALVNKIKDAMDFTKRHSPSVIDIINNSVQLANEALGKLAFSNTFNLNPQAAFSSAVDGRIMNNQVQINLDGAIIADASSATAIAEKIGDSLINKLKLNMRF